jgi:hypothetical protein
MQAIFSNPFSSSINAPDYVVIDVAFASQVQRVMWGVDFAHFNVQWLISKCHSFGFLSSREVARLEVGRNVVFVI